jgi:DNA (cytosine-5)-methyltransferase 1
VAVESYVANLGGLGYVGDLSDPDDFMNHLSAWDIDSVDLLAGGIPCQPFSRAGRSKIRSLVEAKVRSSDDSRADLWQSFARIAEKLRPTAVLLENVPDLASWNDGAILTGFCESLRALGYETDARILNAFEHGVPQFRSRLFIVATKSSIKFDWPQPKARPTLRDAISDLPSVDPGQRIERVPYARPLTPLQRRLRKGVAVNDRRWIDDHITREIRADDAQAFALLNEGGTYIDLPDRLRRYRSDIFTDKYKRLEWNNLCRTITAHMAKDAYWYIHPDQNRTLSIREAARVQTFPDWFRFAGEPSHRYRQIGNAVPPLMAEAVGRAVLGALKKPMRKRRGKDGAFRSALLEWHRGNGRPYPWRPRAAPWAVLLSELCFYRTDLSLVQAVYKSLLELAPTPASLARNSTRVRRLFAASGLDERIDHALDVANAIEEAHGGNVPATREALLQLPHVGDYVASAVLSFGYGRQTVLMDLTTERIASRVVGRDDSQRRWQKRLDLHKLAGTAGTDREFNHALLDLGTLICQPSAPRCLACPVNGYCATFSSAQL